MSDGRFILTLSCEDRPGIVAAVAKFLRDHDGTIMEAAQYGDAETNRFFFRSDFKVIGGVAEGTLDGLENAFQSIADTFAMEWRIDDVSVKPRIMIAVSKFGHCLNDLLYRWRTGALHAEIPVVMSNHDDMRELVEWHDIPYVHLPISKETKPQQEAEILGLMQAYDIDLLVLARYMQILSDDLCTKLERRCINIHHSFLPSFKGAKPYHAAHKRGVKLVGATAHFVTTDLDEGPIIEQDIIRIRHSDTAEDCVARGRDLESAVLARAVRWWTERRVMLNGDKTVIFEK
ncbi:MAG: formyltetrahydrofolate deformylase [Pseudomonadota bacterium]